MVMCFYHIFVSSCIRRDIASSCHASSHGGHGHTSHGAVSVALEVPGDFNIMFGE